MNRTEIANLIVERVDAEAERMAGEFAIPGRVAVFTPADAEALGVERSPEGEPARGAATLSPAACAAAARPNLIADNMAGTLHDNGRPATAATPYPPALGRPPR